MENLSVSTLTTTLLILKTDDLSLSADTRWTVAYFFILLTPSRSQKPSKTAAYCETSTTKNDIRQPGVCQLDTMLHPEVKRDIPHISLHLAKGESEFMVMLVLDSRIWREFEVVMRFDTDDVGEEVASGQREILDDEIERIIGVFDARDGNIADLRTYAVSPCSDPK